jgi:dynein heavy chain
MEFSKWWINEFKTVKYPTQGTVFNYYIDNETKCFLPWNDMVTPYDLDYDVPLQVRITNSEVDLRFSLY